ncbi:hypothetical protein Y1Q_0017600 [Alligator mississippiensis]|uniref:Uncharacterized protein n=1 Tax=Alligator mississippiensis TaxID=8496 RepID=A0A151P2L1_ALLMI|nr:hypothetical protein Y1Q_0017600 [Alligator mississippiensis]
METITTNAKRQSAYIFMEQVHCLLSTLIGNLDWICYPGKSLEMCEITAEKANHLPLATEMNTPRKTYLEEINSKFNNLQGIYPSAKTRRGRTAP